MEKGGGRGEIVKREVARGKSFISEKEKKRTREKKRKIELGFG